VDRFLCFTLSCDISNEIWRIKPSYH
jgi:hypothetical protein